MGASQGGGGANSGAIGDDDNAARRPPADAQQAEDPRDTPEEPDRIAFLLVPVAKTSTGVSFGVILTAWAG